MAFDTAGSGKGSRGNRAGKVRPSINVTPLVDVVLVLLIIFMVVTPLLTKQFWVRVPEKPADNQPPPPPSPNDPPPLVLRVGTDGSLKINSEVIPEADLQARLRRMFAARTDNVLFFDADSDAPYGTAARAMDLARGGGALTIAVLTEQPESTVPTAQK